VGEIKAIEDIETRIGPSGQLDNERGEQVTAVLFVGVPKIEVEISHGSQSTVA
jgi:hypothetical protein